MPAMLAGFSDLFANLKAGARLALFLPVDRGSFRIDAAQLVLLAVVSALLDNGADWIRAEPGAVLDWGATGAELAALAVLVVVAALLAWWLRDPPLLPALPVVVLASFPLVQVANLAPWFVAEWEIDPAWLADTAYYLVLAWFLAVLVRCAYVAMRPGRARFVRALVAGLLLATPLVLPEGALPEDAWWSGAPAALADDATNPASEAIIALQRELQDEALGSLGEHAEGPVDLYFVAFAPDGTGEDARPRIEAARDVMDRQWGTEGRSLAYLNDYATLTETPMASVSHLREALAEVAAVSDPEEDIVMIYLTGRTHPDGTLRVALPPLGLMQLSGPGLAYLLNASELKWRVIVLDACDSRQFAEALADANTAVIAPTRCASHGDAAVFSDTVFDALAGARSIPGALEAARRKLTELGMPPSIHMGEAIAPRLERVRAAEAGHATFRKPRNPRTRFQG